MYGTTKWAYLISRVFIFQWSAPKNLYGILLKRRLGTYKPSHIRYTGKFALYISLEQIRFGWLHVSPWSLNPLSFVLRAENANPYCLLLSLCIYIWGQTLEEREGNNICFVKVETYFWLMGIISSAAAGSYFFLIPTLYWMVVEKSCGTLETWNVPLLYAL